jgi:8-oxo-dGTP diphosphatase
MSEHERLPPVRIVAAVIRDAEGRVLLVRKRGTLGFMQPGGKREPNEDDVTTLARELEEELGCRMRPDSVQFLGELTAPAANEPGCIVEAAVYHVALNGAPAPQAEIAEMIWQAPSSKADVELAPLTRDRVMPLLLSTAI